MAKKTKAPSLADPGEPPRIPKSPMEKLKEEEEQKLADLLRSERIGSITIVLLRRTITQADFSHLAEVAAEGFSVEKIKNVYGGGDYKAQFRDASNGQIVKTYLFKIDPAIPAITPGAPSAQPKTDSMDVPRIVESITAAVKSSLPPPAPPQDNSLFLAMMKESAETNRTFMTAMMTIITKGNSVDPNVTALTQSVTSLRDEVRALKEGGGGSSLAKAVKEFQLIQEITGGGGGGGGDDDDQRPEKKTMMEKAIEIFGPAFAQMLAAQAGGGAPHGVGFTPDPVAHARPVGPAAMPAVGAAPINGAAVPPVDHSADPMKNPAFLLAIAQFRSLALAAAAKRRDPFQWVDGKLDEIPSSYLPQVYALANRETWFIDIFNGDAEASKHLQWVTAMRNAVLTFWFRDEMLTACGTDPRPDATAFAAGFLKAAHEDYHDELFQLIEPGNETWAYLLDTTAFDAAWVEAVRVALDKELSDADEVPAAEPATSTNGVHAAAGSAPPEKKSTRAKRVDPEKK